MIDNIQLRIPYGEIWNTDTRTDTESPVLQLVNQTDKNSFFGTYRNLKIKQSPCGVVVCGSFAKMKHGNNFETFTRREYLEALQELEQVLKAHDKTGAIDLHKATVQSVEFGDTVILKNTIARYLHCFGGYKGFTRNRIDKGGVLECVTYSTRTGGFAFCAYDKGKEYTDKHKASAIPELFQNANVMRLEVRIKGNAGMRAVFGKALTPYDLGNSEVYRTLERRYLDFYNAIEKTGKVTFADVTDRMTSSNFEKMCAEAFRQEHPNEVKDFLFRGKQTGLLSQKEAQRIQTASKATHNYFKVDDDSINELNKRIQKRQRR